MYNNEVTYADKWKTPENEKALEILQRKYFPRSECGPDCPLAWAPEVLEMMEYLEKELGFARNSSSMQGYSIGGKALEWFALDPVRSFFSGVQTQMGFGKYGKYREKTIYKKIKSVIRGTTNSFKYGMRALKVLYVNPVLNRIHKPKIRLGQLKEKYGTLRCYFHTSEAYREFVEREVRKCEIKLAMKGAYLPLESFYNAKCSYNVGNEYRPDILTVTYGEFRGEPVIKVEQTLYRSVMKELGLDLPTIAAAAEKVKEDA